MSRQRPCRPSHADGFTLLDLVIAVTILGVLMVIVIHSLKSRGPDPCRVGARRHHHALLTPCATHVLGREIVVCPSSAASAPAAPTGARLDRVHAPTATACTARRADRPPQGKCPPGPLHGTIGRQRIVYQPNGATAAPTSVHALHRRGPSTHSLICPTAAAAQRARRACRRAACASGRDAGRLRAFDEQPA